MENTDGKTLTGRIIKGVAGMYDVHYLDGGHSIVFTCPARGLFKLHGKTPLPGDVVEIINVDMQKRTAFLYKILPRVSELIRPKAANVTQAVVVFCLQAPAVNMPVLDTLLVYLESQNIRPILCLNKIDLIDDREISASQTANASQTALHEIYSNTGYSFHRTSAEESEGIEELRAAISDGVTIFTGASGVGKSSLLNALFPGLNLETGGLSQKISRGKNTTRTCELFYLGEDAGSGASYLADSPGFTSLEASLLTNLPKEGIDTYFPEFAPFLGNCYYNNCAHRTEHDCAVKDAVGTAIHLSRYENYLRLIV